MAAAVVPNGHPSQLATDLIAGAAAAAGSGSPAAAQAASMELVTKDLLRVAEELRVVVPKGTWQSYGSEEEIRKQRDTDAAGAAAIPSRPPITVQFEVARQAILRHRTSAHNNYVTKEASEDSRDLRSVHNPLYEVMRDEVDTGVQAVPRRSTAATQTHHARRVNAVAQAEPTVVDACIRHVQPPKEEQPNLSAFLEKVLPRTLLCLTQNYQIPIYTDDFRSFNEDDAVVATHDELVLIEKGNYVHSTTKERKVSGVSWRSGRKRDHFVCVASIRLQSLPERLHVNRRCESSVSLVWDLNDPMHPRYLLEAPEEVQVLHFHPTKPSLVAGGALNGQVFLWDLSKADVASFFSSANAQQQQQKQQSSAAASAAASGGETGEFRDVGEVPRMPDSLKGVSLEMDGDVQVPRLQPSQQSRVELSHQGPVHDLQWLPDRLEFGFDGKQTIVNETHQFATISEDGAMLVWDTRPEYLPQDKLRKIKHQSRTGGGEQPWVPLLRYQLSKPDGSGEMPGFRFFFDGCTVDESPSYAAAVASTDGELGFCSMVTQHERRSSIVIPTFGYTKDTRFVRSVAAAAHAGPVYCVERHPIIGDVYLTCGDGCFKVWRAGLLMPLYESPQRPGLVTCAAWSPARPGLILIGTGDGMVEVWDLLDRNPEPMLTHHLVQDAITAISFQPLPHRITRRYTQQLLLGTNIGSFHWYILPPALSRASSGEKKYVRAMLERETRRVAYYDWRWVERQSEIDRFGLQGAAARLRGTIAQAASTGAATAGPGKKKGDTADAFLGEKRPGKDEADARDFDNPYAHDPQRDEEFLELVEKLHQQEIQRMKADSAA
ncbi:WD domain, G-beta repeat [Novymonas esmeraldas]|uniref:WD domain, G-beta repeat n=1 Tax=Novymonas esmeraldas TaxID=1808958 RepID=A0AAW0EQ33_9TRYP